MIWGGSLKMLRTDIMLIFLFFSLFKQDITWGVPSQAALPAVFSYHLCQFIVFPEYLSHQLRQVPKTNVDVCMCVHTSISLYLSVCLPACLSVLARASMLKAEIQSKKTKQEKQMETEIYNTNFFFSAQFYHVMYQGLKPGPCARQTKQVPSQVHYLPSPRLVYFI